MLIKVLIGNEFFFALKKAKIKCHYAIDQTTTFFEAFIINLMNNNYVQLYLKLNN